MSRFTLIDTFFWDVDRRPDRPTHQRMVRAARILMLLPVGRLPGTHSRFQRPQPRPALGQALWRRKVRGEDAQLHGATQTAPCRLLRVRQHEGHRPAHLG